MVAEAAAAPMEAAKGLRTSGVLLNSSNSMRFRCYHSCNSSSNSFPQCRFLSRSTCRRRGRRHC